MCCQPGPQLKVHLQEILQRNFKPGVDKSSPVDVVINSRKYSEAWCNLIKHSLPTDCRNLDVWLKIQVIFCLNFR